MQESTTKCVCHNGFSGYPDIVDRLNFCVGRQETVPQSIIRHGLNHCFA